MEQVKIDDLINDLRKSSACAEYKFSIIAPEYFKNQDVAWSISGNYFDYNVSSLNT